MVNFAGPPGTFPKAAVGDLLLNPVKLEEVRGKILLIIPPKDRTHLRTGLFPFYPKGNLSGAEETEIHANIIESVLRETGIRTTSPSISWILTILVSVLTVIAFFATSPIVGVFSVLAVTVGLFLLAIAGLNSLAYLSILKPIAAIAFAYYFLIPYRLIVEYKGRWRYQQENKLLSEVETLKDNFMSLVSHNLKTPIARIQGIVETLLGSSASLPGTAQAELKRILGADTEDLNRFVSRILHLARVEHPEYQLKIGTKDINQLIEKVIETHKESAQEKGIALASELEPLFPVQIDGELIQESIANLLENAIKYTPAGGHVEVTSSESDDWIQISISDDGPGVAVDDQAKIFSKFYRGADVKNKGIRGSGLGLYLVKYFVELHGGRVACTPELQVGRSSQFIS